MTASRYRPLFDPALAEQAINLQATPADRRGDERPASGYVYDEEGRIALAINVALAAGRPLLVRGKPGTGKSSLARDVADRLGWRYYQRTITSRTRARDLLWSYDTVRRLNDATGGGAKDSLSYLKPEFLWWAFSPTSAANRGLSPKKRTARGIDVLTDPSPNAGQRAVVLLDEIDKADPDLPNDLLTPLGALHFEVVEVEERFEVTAARPPLVVVTTNEERDLPPAFIRRCVVLALPDAGKERLLAIARAHFPRQITEKRLGVTYAAYDQVRQRRKPAEHEPGLAEFLDAVAAVIALGADDDGKRWERLVEFVLTKPAPPAA